MQKAQLFSSDLELYFEDSEHSRRIEALYPISDALSETLLRCTTETNVTFVCFANRSGSNLLLDILGRLDFGAIPGDELFNGDTVENFQREYQFDSFEDYLAFVIETRGKNKTIFLKVGPHQLFWLANRGVIGGYFSRAKYVLSHRADKVAQATSLFIAEKTGDYFLSEDTTRPKPRIEFDQHELLRCLRYVCDVDFLFRYFFAIHSIRPHSILYEDLEDDPARAVGEMSEYCDLFDQLPSNWRTEVDLSRARLKRQRDSLNDELIAKFHLAFSLVGRRRNP